MNSFLKKKCYFLLAVFMIFSFTDCGKKDSSDTSFLAEDDSESEKEKNSDFNECDGTNSENDENQDSVQDKENSEDEEKNNLEMTESNNHTVSNEETIVKDSLTDEEKSQFYISEISDELFARMQGKSYKDDCTVSLDELRYVHVLYVDFNDQSQQGEIVCNKAIAEDLIEIFEELYLNGYEIEKIKLVDEYDAVDESSMADDNSSCFNYRCISYTNTVSKHGLGLAIDINPLYNPYVKTVNGQLSVEPANGTAYVDRTADFEHKIDENDLCYKLFTEHGFEWGGSWKNSKDYQHFEFPAL